MADIAASKTGLNIKAQNDQARWVRRWLYGAAFLVFCLVMVGGATRLTESGLSITAWKPLSGIIPPLNITQWMAEFDAYKLIPEYQKLNYNMSLDEFKVIFYWEWGHRILARAYGAYLGIGLIWFFANGAFKSLASVNGLRTHLGAKLIFIGALSALQAFLGWWMVKSGLVDRVDVSQYRLATHLGAAMILFGALLWVARSLTMHKDLKPVEPSQLHIGFANLLIILTFIQLILGAFVAGTDAGYVAFDWPLMNGQFMPENMYEMQPFWLNWFENLIAIQFNHRIMAYILVVMTSFFAVYILRAELPSRLKKGVLIVLGLIWVQVGLGITVLVAQMHLHVALTHQLVGALFFGLLVILRTDLAAYKQTKVL